MSWCNAVDRHDIDSRASRGEAVGWQVAWTLRKKPSFLMKPWRGMAKRLRADSSIRRVAVNNNKKNQHLAISPGPILTYPWHFPHTSTLTGVFCRRPSSRGLFVSEMGSSWKSQTLKVISEIDLALGSRRGHSKSPVCCLTWVVGSLANKRVSSVADYTRRPEVFVCSPTIVTLFSSLYWSDEVSLHFLGGLKLLQWLFCWYRLDQ